MKFGTVRGTYGLYKAAKFQVDPDGNGFLANFQTSFSYLRNGRTFLTFFVVDVRRYVYTGGLSCAAAKR